MILKSIEVSPLKVVCAAILHNGKILAVQRSATMAQPLKWELPGGKVEKNETEEESLMREIFEELNIFIKIGQRLTPNIHQYSNFSIELIPYLATWYSGNLYLSEHIKHRWLMPSEWAGLDWAEADVPIIHQLIEEIHFT